MSKNNVDVLDERGRKTGKVASITKAADRGLWHAGAHAIIITPSGRIVIQKRSKNIVFYPGKVEIGVGGSVNAGETPRKTIRREILEELGIGVKDDQIYYYGTQRWNHWHPHYKKYTRSFLSTFVVMLEDENPRFKLDVNETQSASIVSMRTAKKLVNRHYLKGIGSLTTYYSYWKYSLECADSFLNPTIHFVCRGNTFRSRLAEAIVKKKNFKNLRVLSSGIGAHYNFNGRIAPHTKKLVKKHKLSRFVKHKWTQTTPEMLIGSDFVVFMNKDVYEDTAKLTDLSKVRYEVWNIPDFTLNDLRKPMRLQNKLADLIYKKIKLNIDDLTKRLESIFPQRKF